MINIDEKLYAILIKKWSIAIQNRTNYNSKNRSTDWIYFYNHSDTV